MNLFFVNQLPVPRLTDASRSVFFDALVSRAARLICTSSNFVQLWREVFKEVWRSAEFWYRGTALSSYGPAEEHEIRRRLAEQMKSLTTNWKSECGVHDRLADRRDTGDRAQLRAEIDAYVAHLYGLKKDDFAYVLDTFPVLKRKEIQAFGEFRSKRKCLEEYDRIGQIPGGDEVINERTGHSE